MSLTPIGDLLIALKADVDDFHKASATASDLVGGLRGTFAQLGRAVRNTGAIITAFSGIATAAIGSVAMAGERLNQAFLEVQTMMEQTDDVVDEFGQGISDLTREFGIQGGQVQTLDGLYFTLSAGIRETDDAMATMEAATKLATVGVTDMQTSVDVLTTTLNAYNIEASDAEEVASGLFGIVREGKMEFDDLAQSFGPLIALASEAGVEWEEAGAALAELTARGFSTRRAATAVRASINQLLRPTDDMKDVLAELSQELGLLDERGRELSNSLEEQRSKMREAESQMEENDAGLRALRRGNEDLSSVMDSMSDDISDLNNDWLQQQMELQEAQAEYRELEAEIQSMEDQFDDLSDSMRDNRIEIMEIRVAAQQQGRELTSAEERQIERLRNANDELRLNQMKTQRDIDNAREEEAQKAEEVAAREEDVSDTRQEIMYQIQDENRELQIEMDELSDSIDDLEDSWDSYLESMGTAILEQEGFTDGMLLLRDRADDMGIPLTSLFTNVRALSGIMPLLEDDMEGVADSLEEIEDPQQDINQLMGLFADEFGINFRGVINSIREVIQLFGMDLAQSLIPTMEGLQETFGGFIDAYNDIDEEVRQGIARFAVLATTIGLIMGPIMLFSGQIMMLASTGLPVLVGMLAGATAIVGGLGARMREISNITSDSTDAVSDLSGASGDAGDEMTRAGQVVEGFEDTVGRLISTIRTIVSIIRDNVLPGFLDLSDGLLEVTGVFTDSFNEARNSTNQMGDSTRDLAQQVGDMLSSLGEWIASNRDLISEIGHISGIITSMLIMSIKSTIGIMLTLIGIVTDVIQIFSNMPGVVPLIRMVGWAITAIILPVMGLLEGLNRLLRVFSPIIKLGLTLVTVFTTLGGAIALYQLAMAKAAATTATSTGLVGLANSAWAAFTARVHAARMALLAKSKAAQIMSISLQTAWRSLMGPLGILIAVVTTLFMAWSNNWLGIRDKTKAVVSFVIDEFSSFINMLEGLVSTTDWSSAAIQGAFTALLAFLPNLTGGWSTGFTDMLNITERGTEAVKSIVDSFGSDLLLLLLGPIGAVIFAWRNNLFGLRDIVTNALDRVKDVILGAVPEFESAGDFASTALKASILGPLMLIFPDLEEWIENFVDTIVSGILERIPDVRDAISEVASTIEDFIGINSDANEGAMSNLTNWGPNTVETYKDGIEDGTPEVQEAMSDMVQVPEADITSDDLEGQVERPDLDYESPDHSVRQDVDEIIRDLDEMRGDFEEVVETLGDTVEELAEKIGDRLAPLMDRVDEELSGGEPEFVEEAEVWGKDTIKHFVNGIQHGLPEVEGAIQEIGSAADGILDPMADTAESWEETVVGTIEDIADSMEIWDDAVSMLEETENWVDDYIADPFTTLVEEAGEWGEQFVEGFVNGMMGQSDMLQTEVEGVAQVIDDYMGTDPDAERGPLSNVSTWGETMVEQLARDISSGKETVNRAVSDIGDTPTIPATEGGGGSKVVVEEGAFKIMPGAFEGVAEEELPERIREEAEELITEEIVEPLEGRGATEPR